MFTEALIRTNAWMTTKFPWTSTCIGEFSLDTACIGWSNAPRNPTCDGTTTGSRIETYQTEKRSSKNPSRVLYSSVNAPFHELCTSGRRHVGHIATGSTCQAPNNSAEQQGAHPSHTAPVVVVMSNETSNHNAAPSQTDESTIIFTTSSVSVYRECTSF